MMEHFPREITAQKNRIMHFFNIEWIPASGSAIDQVPSPLRRVKSLWKFRKSGMSCPMLRNYHMSVEQRMLPSSTRRDCNIVTASLWRRPNKDEHEHVRIGDVRSSQWLRTHLAMDLWRIQRTRQGQKHVLSFSHVRIWISTFQTIPVKLSIFKIKSAEHHIRRIASYGLRPQMLNTSASSTSHILRDFGQLCIQLHFYKGQHSNFYATMIPFWKVDSWHIPYGSLLFLFLSLSLLRSNDENAFIIITLISHRHQPAAQEIKCCRTSLLTHIYEILATLFLNIRA